MISEIVTQDLFATVVGLKKLQRKPGIQTRINSKTDKGT